MLNVWRNFGISKIEFFKCSSLKRVKKVYSTMFCYILNVNCSCRQNKHLIGLNRTEYKETATCGPWIQHTIFGSPAGIATYRFNCTKCICSLVSLFFSEKLFHWKLINQSHSFRGIQFHFVVWILLEKSLTDLPNVSNSYKLNLTSPLNFTMDWCLSTNASLTQTKSVLQTLTSPRH